MNGMNNAGPIGGGGGFGTGDLKSFGYQQSSNKGPIRATDLGLGGGGFADRGYSLGGGGGSSYDVMNTASTKSSMQANNSNYRKAFNPNENGPRPRENVGSYD